MCGLYPTGRTGVVRMASFWLHCTARIRVFHSFVSGSAFVDNLFSLDLFAVCMRVYSNVFFTFFAFLTIIFFRAPRSDEPAVTFGPRISHRSLAIRQLDAATESNSCIYFFFFFFFSYRFFMKTVRRYDFHCCRRRANATVLCAQFEYYHLGLSPGVFFSCFICDYCNGLLSTNNQRAGSW